MNAIELAERATLGSLLVAGESAPEALGWLRPSDFVDPWHGEVCRAIREVGTSDVPIAEAVGRVLLDRLGPTRASLVRIVELMRTAPTHPDPRAYAVMVLDASLRREIASHGVLLRAGALSAVLDGSARPMLAVAAVVRGNLDGVETRWASATGGPVLTSSAARLPLRLGARSVSGPRRLRGTDHALAADRLLKAHPRLDVTEVKEREATLIAALIARPSCLGAVRAWLQPSALTNETWRPVYASMLRLADDGRRIDAVTVAWETQRGPAAAAVDPAVVIARVDAALGASPAYLARAVAADHLRLAADTAARAIANTTNDPALELTQVLGETRARLRTVSAAARPLDAGAPIEHGTDLTLSQITERGPRSAPLRMEGRAG